MRYHWIRQGLAGGNPDPFGALCTQGARFILHRMDIALNFANNSPNPAGSGTYTFMETDPTATFVGGTEWLQAHFSWDAAGPGIDSDISWDFGDEGLILPSHTPFNEYRRFSILGDQITSIAIVGKQPILNMDFSFAFAYEMTGLNITWLP